MAKSEPVAIKFPPGKALAALFDKVVQIALTFPGVEEGRSYGTPAIKVKGKFMARLRSEDEGGLAIRCELIEREAMLEAAPATFYITDHYEEYEMVLIDLSKVDWELMETIVEAAWRMTAGPKLIRRWPNR